MSGMPSVTDICFCKLTPSVCEILYILWMFGNCVLTV